MGQTVSQVIGCYASPSHVEPESGKVMIIEPSREMMEIISLLEKKKNLEQGLAKMKLNEEITLLEAQIEEKKPSSGKQECQ